MKKRLLYILAIGFMIPMLSSCNKWLDESPKAVAVSTFYNNVADADAAIASCVSASRNSLFNGEHIAFLETLSDYGYGRGSWQPNSTYALFNDQNKSRLSNHWTNFYSLIRNANICISKFPDSSGLTDTQKAQYIAEARFYRAFAYFYIVRYWGKGILRTEENMEEWNLPMSSGEDIWNFVISDLKDAVSNCPAKPVLLGRPYKNAAKALLAHVYLTRKDYASALPLVKEVISSNEYALVPVSKPRDFDNIFGPEVTNSTEEVFYMKTSRQNNLNWGAPLYYAYPQAVIEGKPMHAGGGYSSHLLSTENKWYKEWDDNDLRKDFNVLPWPGMNRVFEDIPLDALYAKFRDPDGVGGNNDCPAYRYADVLMMAAEAICQTSGPTAEAMEYLNMIHRRAYGFNPTTPSPADYNLADYNTKDKFFELIVKEHCYEFWGEGKRWPFLVRTGCADKYVKEYKGKTVDPNLYLFPIPANEFSYNEALDPNKDQNPGY